MAFRSDRVVLDSDVLYPFTLRDALLRTAASGLYRPCWSPKILEQTARSLVRNRTITQAQSTKLLKAMTEAFPEAMIEEYERYIPQMKNSVEDRHVSAVAFAAKAKWIVTRNLRDFTSLPDPIKAIHPDDFLCRLYNEEPAMVRTAIARQAEVLRNPPRTLFELLEALRRVVPSFVSAIERDA